MRTIPLTLAAALLLATGARAQTAAPPAGNTTSSPTGIGSSNAQRPTAGSTEDSASAPRSGAPSSPTAGGSTAQVPADDAKSAPMGTRSDSATPPAASTTPPPAASAQSDQAPNADQPSQPPGDPKAGKGRGLRRAHGKAGARAHRPSHKTDADLNQPKSPADLPADSSLKAPPAGQAPVQPTPDQR